MKIYDNNIVRMKREKFVDYIDINNIKNNIKLFKYSIILTIATQEYMPLYQKKEKEMKFHEV